MVSGASSRGYSELPPRTRRIPNPSIRQPPLGGNYLRARGEYYGKLLAEVVRQGTTSAHAENTGFTAFTQSGSWNYLRARGEYTKSIRSPKVN